MSDQDVLKAIDPYIQAERTGTVMIVFGDNSLGRIYLNAGAPTSARYRSLEGMEALAACRSMDVQTVKFHENTDIVRSRKVLQSNYEVLESLQQPSVPEGANQASQQPTVQPAAVSGTVLTPANRQKLGALLIDYIGPVAPLVMSDLPATVDVETALSIVSREIDDTRSASSFVLAARQLLD